MNILEIEFLDGKKIQLGIVGCSDQGGYFSWRGDANQAKRYGYIAVRDGMAVTLNGDAGPGIERIPLSAIRRLKEHHSKGETMKNDPLAALESVVDNMPINAYPWMQHKQDDCRQELQRVRVLIETAREMVEATEHWNESVKSIIGRQVETGIDLVAMKKALTNLGVKP